MITLNDEVTNPILMKIAIDRNLSVEKVRESVDQYYKAIVYLMESGTPHQIKLDFFGKILPKKKFAEIEAKIVKDFRTLAPRNYEIVSNRPNDKGSSTNSRSKNT